MGDLTQQWQNYFNSKQCEIDVGDKKCYLFPLSFINKKIHFTKLDELNFFDEILNLKTIIRALCAYCEVVNFRSRYIMKLCTNLESINSIDVFIEYCDDLNKFLKMFPYNFYGNKKVGITYLGNQMEATAKDWKIFIYDEITIFVNILLIKYSLFIVDYLIKNDCDLTKIKYVINRFLNDNNKAKHIINKIDNSIDMFEELYMGISDEIKLFVDKLNHELVLKEMIRTYEPYENILIYTCENNIFDKYSELLISIEYLFKSDEQNIDVYNMLIGYFD